MLDDGLGWMLLDRPDETDAPDPGERDRAVPRNLGTMMPEGAGSPLPGKRRVLPSTRSRLPPSRATYVSRGELVSLLKTCSAARYGLRRKRSCSRRLANKKGRPR